MPTDADTPLPTSNRLLLAALSREEYERTLPHLGHVSFKLGEVSYVRGGVKVLDRGGLEAPACGRFKVVKNAHDRLPG